MTKTAAPMTSGSIWKQMTFFAMPIFLGNLFQQLYNTVDSLIVGNFLGSSALAAVSSSGSLIFMLIGFLSGISAGAGVIVARFFGAGDEKNLQRAVHTTVAFGLVAGVLMTGVGVALSPQILRWMDTPESVMRESVTYLQIYFAGSLGFVMYNVLVGILQAVGDSRHPLYYLIVSSVINLVLDLLFITGFHTGVGGAAVATVISQIVSALLCFWQLLRTKESYGLKIRKIRYVMPGTIFTTLVIGYLSNLFGTYVIRTLSRLVDIKLFGSIMIFVFMLWFIFLARILILGAVFNATYQELRQGELKSRRGDVITIIQSFSGDGSDSKKHKKHEDDS